MKMLFLNMDMSAVCVDHCHRLNTEDKQSHIFTQPQRGTIKERI